MHDACTVIQGSIRAKQTRLNSTEAEINQHQKTAVLSVGTNSRRLQTSINLTKERESVQIGGRYMKLS